MKNMSNDNREAPGAEAVALSNRTRDFAERLVARWLVRAATEPEVLVDEFASSIRSFVINEQRYVAFRQPVPVPSPGVTVTVTEEIATERQRQIEREGWSSVHDDGHGLGEMARAAACYCLHNSGRPTYVDVAWPWDQSWWKPTNARGDLVKAAALIVAEIERLDRAALRPKE